MFLATIATLVLVCARSCGAEKAEATEPEQIKAEAAVSATVEPEDTYTYIPFARYPVDLDDDLQVFITHLCEDHHIDPSVVFAMIGRESSFQVECIGDNGAAFGLMQIQIQHHLDRMKRLDCMNLFDPYQNIQVGVDYLAELYEDYGDIEKALVAYNAGPSNAYKYWFSAGVYSNDYSRDVLEQAEILAEGVQTAMYRTDDPVADHARWDAEQAREAARYPVCVYCGYSIQEDDLFDINGELYHLECAEEEFQKDTEDYIE